ncbi:MAG: hypothetical protein M1832_000798 [Thelocarpon impressellum]|nr:MAG: hypothetical protein M1832_000798 [Thelocarpon impressellum]
MDVAYDHIQEEALSPDEASEKTRRGNGEKPTLNTEFAEAYKAISSSPWGPGQIIDQTPLSPGLKGAPSSAGTDGTTRADASTSATSSRDKTHYNSEALRESESVLARFRLEASKRLKDIEKAEDAADEALHKFGTNIRNFFQDAVAITPPTDGGNGVDKDGKSQILSDAQLHVFHSTQDSFSKDPASREYASWKQSFSAEKQTDEIAKDLEKFEELRSAMEQLVPAKITPKKETKGTAKGAATEADEVVDWDEDSGPEDSEGKSASQTTIPRSPASMHSSSTLRPTSVEGKATKDALLRPADPRRSNDQHSQPDSDASYELVSGATSKVPSHAPGSPRETKKTAAAEESDEDWE